MLYRPEIDGLRALAVLSVVFYHAHVSWLPGGFLGVDVFFVISGYLITSLIKDALSKSDFSFIKFYDRRSRRLLPALYLVMTISIVPAWFLMPPSAWHSFLSSLGATSAFGSNFLFWREAGYFATASELKPLIHTWSLGIEEQFYLLFPGMFVVLSRLGVRVIFGCLVFGAVSSFAAAVLLNEHYPSPVFFLLPTRGWELLVGSVAAFAFTPIRTDAKQLESVMKGLAATLGVLAIVVAFVFYEPHYLVPGYFSLLAVIGAFSFILGATSRSGIGAIFSTKVLVSVGLLSYSLYLWHQPIFAYLHMYLGSAPPLRIYLLAIAISLFLSYLSYRFVETPIRTKKAFSQNKVFYILIACFTSVFIALAVISPERGHKDAEFRENVTWDDLGGRLRQQKEPCAERHLSTLGGYEVCIYGDLNSEETIAFIGDSHLQAISYRLNQRAINDSLKIISIRPTGCGMMPALGTSNTSIEAIEACDGDWTEVLRYVSNETHDLVFLHRWTYQLFPVDKEITMLDYVNSFGVAEPSNEYRETIAFTRNSSGKYVVANKALALRGFFNDLVDSGFTITLLGPIPEQAWNVSRVLWRQGLQAQAVIYVTREEYIRRNSYVNSIFEEMDNASSRLRFLPMTDIFCRYQRKEIQDYICPISINGQLIYLDDDHLADAGADLVLNALFEKLDKK